MGRGRGAQGGGSIPTGCRPGVEETSTVVSQEEKGASRRPVLPKVPAGWGSVAEQRREGVPQYFYLWVGYSTPYLIKVFHSEW